jgi:hypothetical protein
LERERWGEGLGRIYRQPFTSFVDIDFA